MRGGDFGVSLARAPPSKALFLGALLERSALRAEDKEDGTKTKRERERERERENEAFGLF